MTRHESVEEGLLLEKQKSPMLALAFPHARLLAQEAVVEALRMRFCGQCSSAHVDSMLANMPLLSEVAADMLFSRVACFRCAFGLVRAIANACATRRHSSGAVR